MKGRLSIVALCLLLLAGCRAQPSRLVEDVIFCGVLIDPADYIVKDGNVFIDEAVICEKAGYLPVKDEANVSFKTVDERILSVPVKSDLVVEKDRKRYVNMENIAEGKDDPSFYDEERKLWTIGIFDRKDLAYSDITYEETLRDPDIKWKWPEGGIEGVDVVKEKGTIAFVFKDTGEVLGTIAVNPKDFPKKGQLLLGAREGNYLVASLKEKEARQWGQEPSRRAYAIDGILSLLTSVRME
ncbi:MAG: hypothetical protein SOW18_06260 [Peptoniphilus sp.]|nr:hypothetical protein [Peptoniphilus sp.]MDY3119121.1 hypothetical protein [Peptoniphilus sp.]